MSDMRAGARPKKNEGEGNKTAARKFNEAEQRFVRTGRVAEKAREAARALDGPERRELEEAEAIGKSHAAGEDPAVDRPAHPVNEPANPVNEKVRHRAYEIWESAGRPEGEADAHWQQAERDVGGT